MLACLDGGDDAPRQPFTRPWNLRNNLHSKCWSVLIHGTTSFLYVFIYATRASFNKLYNKTKDFETTVLPAFNLFTNFHRTNNSTAACSRDIDIIQLKTKTFLKRTSASELSESILYYNVLYHPRKH